MGKVTGERPIEVSFMPWMRIPIHAPVLASVCFVLAIAPSAAAQEGLDAALERATHEVLKTLSPSIVQIRTVGGLEVLHRGRLRVRRGLGPTTGVIVSPDGYIISSSFNFAHRPSAITVSLPGRTTPLNAKVVATDHTRMLTLLKVEATDLPVPEFAAKDQVRVGQWVLALGRTLSNSPTAPPSVSVGIVSAVDRIWGKAIQTDAKVSPVNYGGPLVDFQGRVVGILVPLSPQSEDELAGVEWYDGGIGFAIPMSDILRVLPRLKQGKDLKKGILGVRLRRAKRIDSPPVIGSVAFGSAAARAGLQAGDQIVEVDGTPVIYEAQVRHVLGNRYEGDQISLKVKRGDEIVDFPKIILGQPPTSFRHAFLGILPVRDDADPGVEVRHVFANSPAAAAGLQVGDRILAVNGRPAGSRDQMIQLMNRLSPDMKIKLRIRQAGKEEMKEVEVKLAAMEAVLPPADLPPGSKHQALKSSRRGRLPRLPAGPEKAQPKPDRKPAETKKPKTGRHVYSDPVTGHEYWVYVPENYDPNTSHGLIVWLHRPGQPMTDVILRRWRDVCAQRHWILLAPQAGSPTGWLTSEVDLIKDDLRTVMEEYTIDRQRVVAHGHGQGATLALYLAFDARETIRGVAAVGGALPGEAKENLSALRLNFFLVTGEKDPGLDDVRAAKKELTAKYYPVFYRELPNQGDGYIDDDTIFDELIRWIESLDRL